MSTHGNEKTTGAFRFDSQWHVHERVWMGNGMPGTPFDGFEKCSDCGGKVRYCGLIPPHVGLGNSHFPEQIRLAWENERRIFADISKRCSCDRDGDRAYAVEYDRRPFSISYDGSATVPDTQKVVASFLEKAINRVIEGLERLRKRIS